MFKWLKKSHTIPHCRTCKKEIRKLCDLCLYCDKCMSPGKTSTTSLISSCIEFKGIPFDVRTADGYLAEGCKTHILEAIND